MRVTKRQALQLFDIVSASLQYDMIGPWEQYDRRQLVNEIVAQQDDVLEVEDGDSVVETMRKLLRDQGVVSQGMGIAVNRTEEGVTGVEAVPLRERTEEKAAYDW